MSASYPACVLLAEDEDDTRLWTCEILEQEGFRVLLAANGAEALLVSGQIDEPIDLLLTDLAMPFVGGRRLAKQLSATRPSTRVLFMSAHSREELERDGSLVNGESFLPKPFSSVELVGKIREVLES